MDRANAGDVEGLMALYQLDAVLAFPSGKITVGREAIRRVYTELLAKGPKFKAVYSLHSATASSLSPQRVSPAAQQLKRPAANLTAHGSG
jgi:hypothetical protein